MKQQKAGLFTELSVWAQGCKNAATTNLKSHLGIEFKGVLRENSRDDNFWDCSTEWMRFASEASSDFPFKLNANCQAYIYWRSV